MPGNSKGEKGTELVANLVPTKMLRLLTELHHEATFARCSVQNADHHAAKIEAYLRKPGKTCHCASELLETITALRENLTQAKKRIGANDESTS